MAYATPDQLAVALDIRVTPANTDLLEACLEAAAAEIDHTLDRIDPLPDPAPELGRADEREPGGRMVQGARRVQRRGRLRADRHVAVADFRF